MTDLYLTYEQLVAMAIDLIGNALAMGVKSVQWNDKIGTGHLSEIRKNEWAFEMHWNPVAMSQAGLNPHRLSEELCRQVEARYHVPLVNYTGCLVVLRIGEPKK